MVEPSPSHPADPLSARANADAAYAGWSDVDLLAGMAADHREANRRDAARLRKADEFRRRRERDYEARRAAEPRFTMTPLRETAVEVAPVLGMSEGKVRHDLRVVRRLADDFPGVLGLLTSGQLDLYRARLLVEAADTHLETPEVVRAFAEQMTAWFAAHLRALGNSAVLVTKTPKQISNRISYLVKKLQSRKEDERFRRAFVRRAVHLDDAGTGMGHLTLNHDIVSLQSVDYRLTLIAKSMRRRGEARTLAQLRSDLMVDLLMGRLTVGATTGELEDPDSSPTGDPLDTATAWPEPRWARPIINVTVPIQTLMGLSDDPGVLAGGASLPASLVRRIAGDPQSTWFRMLTDPARSCAELSTKSYQPTGPVWRQVVAEHPTCFAPGCQQPATACELDQRVPWPRGATSTENLGPACTTHHQAKHSPGFGLTRTQGGLRFTTAAGSLHVVEEAEQPVADSWGATDLLEFQPTAAEFWDTMEHLAHERERLDGLVAHRFEEEQYGADLRASYPDAPEDVIQAWIHADSDSDMTPPPIRTRGITDTQRRLQRRTDQRERGTQGDQDNAAA